GAFEVNLEEEDFVNLIRSLTEQGQASASSNLRHLGYKDLSEPTQINLYPQDFSTKDDVINFIAEYNQSMQAQDKDDKVVTYTDFVGALMSSVTTIINTISYALIAFVAISLVVSSIMIGVITYVSVLERIKEIGILRAIGASKKDIRRVFNAETLIIGFIAGAFGIFVTYLITIVANILVYNKFGIQNIAHLEMKASLILIAISMFLAFISGLMPASTAANKDPVEALRSE
ncbi:MAG TPA: FtsX-like permease family protein, partial [Erysipelothrix sp.]